jgi:hypothetical protein
MFDHVKFGVSDYVASKGFFLKALEPLGVSVVQEGPPTYGVELSPKGKASLCMYQTERHGGYEIDALFATVLSWRVRRLFACPDGSGGENQYLGARQPPGRQP